MAETPQQYTQRILSYSEGTDALELLESAPQRLGALLDVRSKEQLINRPAPDKWSVAEVAAHLGDAEIAMSWRIRQILSTNAVPIQAYDQDASIPKKLWDNYGIHEERGNESIAHMARLLAGHDLNHLRQIEAILKG